MKYFVIILLLIVFASVSFEMPQALAAAPRGDPAEIILDKDFYSPGDKVNLEIHFNREWGSSIELSVIQGPHTENRIFTALEPITDFSQPLKISFILPDDSEFYQYLIVATIAGEGNYDNLKIDYIPNVMLYTKKDADKVLLSDFFIEFGNVNGDVRPGQSVPIKFKIVDGLGNTISNAFAHVGICDESFAEPPSWIAVLPGHRYGIKNSESYSGCIFLQRNIPSFNDEFDFNVEIPNDAPQGKYKLNIWSELSFPFDEILKKSPDINISGDPINLNQPAIVMITDKQIDFVDIPEFLIDDEYLIHDQKIKFYSYQMANPGGDIRGNPQNIPDRYKDDCCIGILPAIPDVNVHIFVIGPDGSIVFDEQTNGGEDGNFDYLTFHLTEDLKPGVYEIYYNITKNGNYIQHRGSNNPDVFYLVKNTKFTVDAEGESFDVYFQGIDVTASNMEFDLESKSLTFDLEKLDGTFSNRYFSYGQNTGSGISCPIIYIEQPLLSGYFTTTFNDYEIGTCNSGFGKITDVVGPIYEDGKLKIIGTYVIPEFGKIVTMILVLSVLPIVLISKFRVLRNY